MCEGQALLTDPASSDMVVYFHGARSVPRDPQYAHVAHCTRSWYPNVTGRQLSDITFIITAKILASHARKLVCDIHLADKRLFCVFRAGSFDFRPAEDLSVATTTTCPPEPGSHCVPGLVVRAVGGRRDRDRGRPRHDHSVGRQRLRPIHGAEPAESLSI